MRDGWRWRLAALAAVVGAIVVVLLIVEDGSTSNAEAVEAIEALPYRVKVREVDHGVLIGTIWSHRGTPVHFAVGRSYDAQGIPARLRRIDQDPTGGGGFLVWSDAESWLSRGSGPAWNEAINISVDVEEALCRKATGHTCGI